MKNYTILFIVLYSLCTNCFHPAKQVDAEYSSIKDIDILASIANSQKVNLSTIASDIDYCILETDKKCLVTPGMSIYCSKDYIVTIGGNQGYAACYVFERKTGKFVRQISREGQGPGEYTETMSPFWDGENEQVCFFGNNQYLFYNLDGTLSHRINRFTLRMTNFLVYKDLYVGYVHNSFGNSTIRIAFFDTSGILVDSISEYRSWERTHTWWTGGGNEGRVYNFCNELYYKDIYCDTLYQIKDFTLHPRYIFNTGGKAVPYKMQEDGQYDLIAAMRGGEYDRYEKYIVINSILTDKKFLYFTFDYRKLRYPVIYNKMEDRLRIMSPVSIPPPSRDAKGQRYGFENDLDGGLPCWPVQMISEKEMMCVYSAEDLLKLDISKITDEKLKTVLNDIEIENNPVVAIVTLKD